MITARHEGLKGWVSEEWWGMSGCGGALLLKMGAQSTDSVSRAPLSVPSDLIKIEKVIKGRCCRAEAPSTGSSRQAGTRCVLGTPRSLGQGITRGLGLFSHLPSGACPCPAKHTQLGKPAPILLLGRASPGQGWISDAFPCFFAFVLCYHSLHGGSPSLGIASLPALAAVQEAN